MFHWHGLFYWPTVVFFFFIFAAKRSRTGARHDFFVAKKHFASDNGASLFFALLCPPMAQSAPPLRDDSIRSKMSAMAKLALRAKWLIAPHAMARSIVADVRREDPLLGDRLALIVKRAGTTRMPRLFSGEKHFSDWILTWALQAPDARKIAIKIALAHGCSPRVMVSENAAFDFEAWVQAIRVADEETIGWFASDAELASWRPSGQSGDGSVSIDGLAAGKNALMIAVSARRPELAKRFEPLFDPAEKDADGCTALMLAAQMNDSAMVSVLAPKSDCEEKCNIYSWTAFQWAANHGSLAALQILWNFCDPRALDAEGRNALMLAARWASADCVRLFLERCPEMELQRDSKGLTAADWARQGQEETLKHHEWTSSAPLPSDLAAHWTDQEALHASLCDFFDLRASLPRADLAASETAGASKGPLGDKIQHPTKPTPRRL